MFPNRQKQKGQRHGVHLPEIPYPTSERQRAVRFLSDRYAQRERPSVAAELILLAVIVLTAAWPLITLARMMARIR